MPFRNLANICLLFLTVLSACHGNIAGSGAHTKLQESVSKAVTIFTDSVAADVTAHGIESWLKYFSQSPSFFMASEGDRVFPNFDSATNEIKEKLSKQLIKIDLSWQERYVDSLSPVMAGFSSRFHEDLTGSDGKVIPTEGYVTGIIEKTGGAWKFRNLHWSIRRLQH